MPKGFTEREKEIIRSTLIEKGQAFFTTHGIRKTSVEDLTRAAGISKGAFYLFFGSKEELFFEILEQFEAEFRQSIFAHVFQPGKSGRQNFKHLLKNALLLWDTYPLLKNFDREEFEYLLRKIPPEKVTAHINRDDAFVAQFIEKSKQEGLTIPHDPQVVSGLMKALFFVSLHKDDFGQEAYPQTMDLLIDLVGNYLVEEEKGLGIREQGKGTDHRE